MCELQEKSNKSLNGWIQYYLNEYYILYIYICHIKSTKKKFYIILTTQLVSRFKTKFFWLQQNRIQYIYTCTHASQIFLLFIYLFYLSICNSTYAVYFKIFIGIFLMNTHDKKNIFYDKLKSNKTKKYKSVHAYEMEERNFYIHKMLQKLFIKMHITF